MNPHLEVAVGTLDDVTRAPMPREFFVIQNQVQHALFPLLPSPAPFSRPLFFAFEEDSGKELTDFFSLSTVFPRIQVAAGVLDENPPLALTSASMEGIVVSRETVAGAAAINEERK